MKKRNASWYYLMASVMSTGMTSTGSVAAGLGGVFDLDLEQLLDLRVSVSTRSETSINHSPSTVTVYSQQDIQRMGVDSLETLLNFVSGFQSARTDDEGRSYMPTVRGRKSSASGNDILVLLDGVRLNDPVLGGAFVQDSLINLDYIRQVEIIRGPGSALYGSNAFAAVINLVSQDDVNDISMALGSFNARRASLNLADSLGSFDWSFAASYYQDNGEQYAPFYDFNGLRKDTRDPMKHNDYYFSIKSSWMQLYIRRAARLFGDFVNFGALAETTQRYKLTNESVRLVFNYHLNDGITINPFVDYWTGNEDNLLGLSPATADDEVNLWWDNNAKIEAIGGNIRDVEHIRGGADGQWLLNDKHQWHFGGLWRREQIDLNPFQGNWDADILVNQNLLVPSVNGQIQRGFWIDGVRFDLFTPQQRKVWGAYIQDQWLINDAFTLTTGIRYDRYDDFGANVSLRGGLVYTYDSQRTFKLLYGEAFRAPTLMETRAGVASGGLSNPDLQPETVQTIELGWIEGFDWGRLQVTYYLNQIEDTIGRVTIADQVTGITATQPQNGRDVDIQGFELEADFELQQHWFLRAGLSHLNQPKALEPVARTSGHLILNYRDVWFDKAINVNMKTFYHAKVLSRQGDGVDFAEDRYLDSYWNTSVTSRFQLAEKWQLIVHIDNIGDSHYSTFSQQLGIDDGLPSRGRSYQLAVEYQF